jgi:AsmA protein
MQTDPHHKAPAAHAQHQAAQPNPQAQARASENVPAAKRLADLAKDRRTRLILIAGGSVIAVAILALIAVNLLISADWVRERVASRIREQTGRELTVNGTTALLFTPSPKVIITDATITDPEARAGTADLTVGRLVLELSLIELLSRQVDAESVVLEQPVLTMRLGSGKDAEAPKQKPNAAEADEAKGERTKPADADEEKPRREVKLRDVRIEDGTVAVIYDAKGTERRVEHINASLSLPALADPFTGSGKFDWKDQTVDFSFSVTSLADLRAKRPAKLTLGLDTPAIAARFDGSLLTRPKLSGEGELSAKAHSIPSLLAWMREKPSAESALGDGELASHLAWNDGEITVSGARFALEHASGQGEAVVTLKAPRPYIRAALALDHLDLNPFLANGKEGSKQRPAEPAASPEAKDKPSGEAPKGWFSKPDGQPNESAAEPEPAPDATPQGEATEAAPPSEQAAPAPPTATRRASPASFDADVNLNVRQTRVAHLELGPASLGLAFRDGVLNATLGGLDLYDGHASGKLVLDASRDVPAFTGNFRLDGVQAKPLLSDAAQFSMLEGPARLALEISGAGRNADEIKSSLAGQGSLALSEGAIDGIDLTAMISQLGEGQIPELRQGPGNKTSFSDLGGSFTIAKGIAETNNLQMTSPLLKVAAAGTVDLTQSTINMLATPEIVAGPEGQKGANDLAGLSVPVRIEGPLDRPTMRPEIKGMFANPEKTGKAINSIGKALEKKFKGRPVGEAIGRFLGNVQIGPRGESDGAGPAPEPQANRKRPNKKQDQNEAAKPDDQDAGAPEEAAPEEKMDPDLERILR